jgi:K+-transporting ATPase ATPase C chain
VRRHLISGIVLLLGLTVVLGFGYPFLVTGISELGFGHDANGSLVYSGGKLVGSSLIGQSFTDSSGNPLPGYFQPRPSAAGSGYDGASSGATNLGPSNPLLIGFVPGVNTVGTDGEPSASNPFATRADPECVPMSAGTTSVPVVAPTSGEKFEMTRDGSYVCDPNTVPERAIAYRSLNGLAPGTPVPVDAVTASGSALDPDISIQNALDQASRVAKYRHISIEEVMDLVHRYTAGRERGFLGEPSVNVLELNLALEGLE